MGSPGLITDCSLDLLTSDFQIAYARVKQVNADEKLRDPRPLLGAFREHHEVACFGLRVAATKVLEIALAFFAPDSYKEERNGMG